MFHADSEDILVITRGRRRCQLVPSSEVIVRQTYSRAWRQLAARPVNRPACLGGRPSLILPVAAARRANDWQDWKCNYLGAMLGDVILRWPSAARRIACRSSLRTSQSPTWTNDIAQSLLSLLELYMWPRPEHMQCMQSCRGWSRPAQCSICFYSKPMQSFIYIYIYIYIYLFIYLFIWRKPHNSIIANIDCAVFSIAFTRFCTMRSSCVIIIIIIITIIITRLITHHIAVNLVLSSWWPWRHIWHTCRQRRPNSYQNRTIENNEKHPPLNDSFSRLYERFN